MEDQRRVTNQPSAGNSQTVWDTQEAHQFQLLAWGYKGVSVKAIVLHMILGLGLLVVS